MSGGRIAPPTTAMTSSDETWLLRTPILSSASEKIFGQPMEVKSPMPTTHHIATCPPTTIAATNSATMVAEKMDSVRPGNALPNWNNTQHKASMGR